MTIFFPDVASYQAGLDLSGALAVIIKATEGTGYTNPEWANFHAEAARHGTLALGYHFLSAGNGAGQAAHCRKVAGAHPLMLDFEPATSRPRVADAVSFIDAYRTAGGLCWLLYLPHWYWQELGSPNLEPFAKRGMILVSSNYGGYTDSNAGAGWQPYGGMTPRIWQYSSTTPFNRQKVDFNAFRGNYAGRQDPPAVAACLAEFRSLVSTGRDHPAPAPAPAPDGYRHEVGRGNDLSLATVAERRNSTVGVIASFSLNFLNEANAAVLRAYVALDEALMAAGHSHPVMPAGLVYWTRLP